MAELYWSCAEGSIDDLLAVLLKNGHHPQLISDIGRTPVFAVSDPGSALVRLTAELLRDERIVSAALTARPLPSNELYLATEWRRRMVVEKSEVTRMVAASDILQAADGYPPRGLVIFKLGSYYQKSVDPDLWQGKGEPTQSVLASHEDYYGEFADPEVGGAQVLFAAGLEMARVRGLGQDRVIVGLPEAFGFTRDYGENSVIAWRRKGVIAVEAVGFGLESEDELARMFERHKLSLDCAGFARDAEGWLAEGLSFGVGIVLRGLQDPPVIIPVGSVYQQALGSTMQNLAVAKSANPIVGAGATVPLILPAWCLNPSFSPPSGPMTPTPLVAASASGSQQAVWAAIRGRYGRGP